MTIAQLGRPATYEDVLAAPSTMIAELLGGMLHLSARPASRHTRAASRLGMALGPFDGDPDGDDPGGWIILDEPELRLGDTVVVPDLAGWRRERMPELPDAPSFTLVPDWVCEVASPATRREDRLLKLPLYRRVGVPWVWIVDPQSETVDVHEGDGARWILAATAVGAGAVHLPPFDARALDPGRWFAR
jgi:hypothetical protein